jgi:hypothetical protein
MVLSLVTHQLYSVKHWKELPLIQSTLTALLFVTILLYSLSHLYTFDSSNKKENNQNKRIIMRKFFTAVLISASLVSSAFAADATGVNSKAVNRFRSEFKSAEGVTWTNFDQLTKASFILDNERMEVYYSADGELVGTAKGSTIDNLPTNAKRSFVKKYDGYTVKEVVRFEGQDGNVFYISAENEKNTVILKVDEHDQLYTFKKTNK